ncbi:DcrB-related protein [Providencia stuartii]|nr:DcrB-related protein [Providencia stuartii]
MPSLKRQPLFAQSKVSRGSEIYCETKQKGISIYQWIAAFHVEDNVLVVTYSQIKPFSNAELAHWRALRDSFTPHSN